MKMKEKSTISCINVTKQFWQAKVEVPVLNGISAEFLQGKSYAITGASGSGKSTLLHILGGLDQATSGTVMFDGQDIFTMKNKEHFRNQKIGFVFQFHYLIKELSILENVMMMGILAGKLQQECQEKAQALLEEIGLSHRAHFFPSQLSGGEQQRVSIARAIFNKPNFLIADEPTGNLDAPNALLVVELFQKAQKDWDMGLIVCSHDEHVYSKMETIYRLENGMIQDI